MSRLVCFSGLPGVGKSTVARALAPRIGALWLRIDRIEDAMKASHMQTDDLADGGYAAAQAVAGAALEQGFDVVADCVNPIAPAREAWQATAKKAGARHCDIWLTCSDVSEHRARIDARPGMPDWPAVVARQFESFETADLHLDTAGLDAAACVARIEKFLEDHR